MALPGSLLDTHQPLDVEQVRAVNADEALRIEGGLEIGKSLILEIRAAAALNGEVVVLGLDVVDHVEGSIGPLRRGRAREPANGGPLSVNSRVTRVKRERPESGTSAAAHPLWIRFMASRSLAVVFQLRIVMFW